MYLILTLLLLNKVLDEDRASESQLIQDIKFTRHRLELMFRVAHMNRDKTKLLVKSIEPKEPSEGTMIRPPRYNPRQILDKTKVTKVRVLNFQNGDTTNVSSLMYSSSILLAVGKSTGNHQSVALI